MKNICFNSTRLNPHARARLFCFPFAGGGAAAFRLWKDSLPIEIDLVPIQYPGRGSRFGERPIVDMAQLVDGLCSAISHSADLPYAFFGHSMGATVSFEVARTLRRRGVALPEHLFVSARPAPHEPSDRPDRHDLPHDEFLKVLRELEGTPEAFFEHQELIEFMLPTLRADFQLLETYQFLVGEPNFDFPITAFSGSSDPETPPSKMESWRLHTRGGFKERSFTGGHFYLDNHVQLLCDEVASSLLKPEYA